MANAGVTRISEWQTNRRMDYQIATAIALWAAGKETGTALPADTEFGCDLDFAASPSSYRRPKNLLTGMGILGSDRRRYFVA